MAQRGSHESAETKLGTARRAVQSIAETLAELDRSLSAGRDAWDQERRTLGRKLETAREDTERLRASSAEQAATLRDHLRERTEQAEVAQARCKELEGELARVSRSLELLRVEESSLRIELAKEREVRLEAVSKERSEAQRRLREQIAQALGGEFAKVPVAGAPDAGPFALKLLAAVRQRLQAQGIEV